MRVKAEKIPVTSDNITEELGQLEREQRISKSIIRELRILIREYFEKQFGLPALEQTTTESLKIFKRPHAQGTWILPRNF